MKKYQFKTNIMCSSCIAKVTPGLNEILGVNQWQVDIKDSKKILTVTSESANEKDVIKALEKVGYKAEEIN
jgi:copper chaperone CopZ